MSSRVLLVGYNPDLLATLRKCLAGQNLRVERVTLGQEAVEKALSSHFDVIVVNLQLPDREGFDVCYEIRRARVASPILFLSDWKSPTDEMVGLRLGGDDYLVRPFAAEELLDRVQALIRRQSINGAADRRFGKLRLNLKTREIERGGRHIELQAREFRLLQQLVENAGTTLTRQDLLRDVWCEKPHADPHLVDVYISRLRHKLEENPGNPDLIITIPGVGFQMR